MIERALRPDLDVERSARQKLPMPLLISTLVKPERKRSFSECWEREIA